jgi:hypothetical protein
MVKSLTMLNQYEPYREIPDIHFEPSNELDDLIQIILQNDLDIPSSIFNGVLECYLQHKRSGASFEDLSNHVFHMLKFFDSIETKKFTPPPSVAKESNTSVSTTVYHSANEGAESHSNQIIQLPAASISAEDNQVFISETYSDNDVIVEDGDNKLDVTQLLPGGFGASSIGFNSSAESGSVEDASDHEDLMYQVDSPVVENGLSEDLFADETAVVENGPRKSPSVISYTIESVTSKDTTAAENDHKENYYGYEDDGYVLPNDTESSAKENFFADENKSYANDVPDVVEAEENPVVFESDTNEDFSDDDLSLESIMRAVATDNPRPVPIVERENGAIETENQSVNEILPQNQQNFSHSVVLKESLSMNDGYDSSDESQSSNSLLDSFDPYLPLGALTTIRSIARFFGAAEVDKVRKQSDFLQLQQHQKRH